MSPHGITAASLLRIHLAQEAALRKTEKAQAEGKRPRKKAARKVVVKAGRPIHRPVRAFWEQVARDQIHPLYSHDPCPEAPGWVCLDGLYHLNHRHARWWPRDVELKIDAPPELVRDELVPVDVQPPRYRYDQLTDRDIIGDPAAWPEYPRLVLENTQMLGRGGELVGHLRHGDTPRGRNTIRVRRPTSDVNLDYQDVGQLLKAGWRVRRDLLDNQEGGDT